MLTGERAAQLIDTLSGGPKSERVGSTGRRARGLGGVEPPAVVGDLEPQAQSGDGISHAAKLTVDDARIDFTHPALAVDRLVRGCTPTPGAWTTFRGERLKVGPVTVTDESLPVGTIEARKREALAEIETIIKEMP